MGLSGDILQISIQTPESVCMEIAARLKQRRLELNLTQQGLAGRSGVNIETYRRFERSGEISLANLVRLSIALDMTSDFEALFSQKQYETLDELMELSRMDRKRGKRG